MSDHKIYRTPSAYSYPLLIKQLLNTLELRHPDQEIVYADHLRYTYRAVSYTHLTLPTTPYV